MIDIFYGAFSLNLYVQMSSLLPNVFFYRQHIFQEVRREVEKDVERVCEG